MSGNTAPVYSIIGEQRSRAEEAAWSHFVAAADSAEFFAAWLALLAARVERTRAALLLTGQDEGGPFGVGAAWPDRQRDLRYLGGVAERALGERGAIVAAAGGGAAAADGAAHIGYPVEVGGQLIGAVVLDVGAGTDLQAALRQIHWASAWLVDHFRQQQLAQRDAELERFALLNELLASALQQRRLQASALAVSNELALRLRCDRVSVGLEDRARITLIALSNTASFDRRSDGVRPLLEAMEEVLDLGVAIVWPLPADDELGAISHAAAVRKLQAQAMLSVPLLHEAQMIGVITFERQAGLPFDAAEQRSARAVGALLGPVWALQRAQERPLWQRARDTSHAALRATLGPRHPGRKLVAGALAATLAALALIATEHRVSARTVIEGSTQRAAAAPFDGFLAAGLVRAGETVRAGQPLARLDTRDLELETARWSAEREQLRRRHQVAMAQADRGAMGVLAAQVGQTEAQLALAQDKLTRATLVAPFDGVVVSGDLSQQIGMPVEQGKLLFEVAPLDGYRVVLQVDDRDIGWLALGQRGQLLLSGLPDRAMPFRVSAITPVAMQAEGRNVFRVEARLDAPTAGLRPGMEGVGKVVVGARSVLWIWTHGFFDGMRLALWNWMP